MRIILTGALAAAALSFAVASAAVASPNTDGGDAFASKILTNNNVTGVTHGIEGARNDGEEASFGFVVPNSRPSQNAAMPEREDPSAE